MNVWDKDFPDLVLASPREDIYSDCHIYHNQFRYFTRSKAKNRTDDDNYYSCFIDSRMIKTEKKTKAMKGLKYCLL